MAAQPIMLRIARPIGSRARTQLFLKPAQIHRFFADKPSLSTKDSMLSSDPAFKPEVPLGPAGPSSSAPKSTTPAAPTTVSSIPPEKVPLSTSSPIKVQVASPSAVPPPLPPPPAAAAPPAPKKFRRTRIVLYLLLASALGYGGAVFYALQSDNFHDFFTEYVPFGEEALLYFEERSFHKRFPDAKQNTYRVPPSKAKAADSQVTIPSRAGLSWKVSEEKKESAPGDVSHKGRHMSALDTSKPKEAQPSTQSAAATAKAVATVDKVKKDTPPAAPVKPVAQPEKTPVVEPPSVATPSPKSDPRPPAIPPVTQISPLKIANAGEPIVQELVKIVNDLITVINADSADASNKYSAPITKAKESLGSVGAKILALKEAEKQAAEERVKQAHQEFDEGAKQLLMRIETAQREDDAKYREEFEAERTKLSQSYEDKLKSEIERSQQLADQRLENELTEQAIEMKRSFISDIKSLVEKERDGRLSKLSDLSTSVDSLQELTSNWNGVIDSNLATQKLQVAVDAVHSALNSATASDARPKPFVREMAALKLVADGDPIVDAAIASINPAAYQRGIPSPAQLIDRYRRVASEVRKASLLPEEAGVASHAASVLLSKLMFKKHGQPEGSDVESVLTRTETMLEEGDLDGAAREMNTLNGWAGVLSKDWLQDCRKVLEVKQALEVIETEAKLQCLRVE